MSFIGRDIGPYHVVSLLGAGGMGEVYLARDTKLGRAVALKVVPALFVSDPDRLARFEREARVLATLNHPHIGSIYGFEDAGGIRALVLELVEGPTLAELLAQRTPSGLPIDEALTFARQIAQALEAAHDKGIIHRDLKPANIKITGGSTVKVLDFGLAKAAAGDEPHLDLSHSPTITAAGTRAGILLGTAAYMSPEQARGKIVDKRTDIWAFGCVLYEMLTGRSAFTGESVSDIVAAVLQNAPDWRALPGSTPSAIVQLLRRCLEKDPARRLHDIADARIEIDDALAGNTGVPAAETKPSTLKRYLLFAVAAAIISAVAASAVAWNVARGELPPAQLRLAHAVRLTNTPTLEFGPAISPDGKWVAYYSTERGPTDVWVKILDSGATLNLTASLKLELPTRITLGGLAISPDGGSIAFAARPDPALQVFDTWLIPAPVGGNPQRLLQVMQGMQWSPDGRHVVCIRPGSARGDALIVADADGANQRELIPAAGGRHIHWPVWSRDGGYLYFIYSYTAWNAEPSEIYRIPFNGGAIEAVIHSTRRASFPVPLDGGGLLYSANFDSVDLGLWWQPPGTRSPRPLTGGIGEHAQSRLSADGRRLVSSLIETRQALVALPVAGGPPKRLTDGFTGDVDPSLDASHDRLVFSSSRSGHRNLWVARPDGADARPLTSGTAVDERPAFSPDGQHIVFISDRSGRRGIWIISAEGGAPKLLTEAVVLDLLTWSRDGKEIVYSTPGQVPLLKTVAVSDGKVGGFSTPTGAVAPAWSPSSDVIAYLEPATVMTPGPTSVASSRMWLRFVDGQGQPLYSTLAPQQFINGLLAWAPDGRRLAVASIPAYATATVWVVDPSAPTPYKKVADLAVGVRPHGMTWTRDGSAVIISSEESTGDIVLYDLVRD